MSSVALLPPKTAQQYADRALKGDGCVKVGTDTYQFTYGNMVVTLMPGDPPMGHVYKDARRAAEIRAAIAKATGAA